MRNWCPKCNGMGYTGWLWWKEPCAACGGDGIRKPPGWPDLAEIDRLRPPPSLPPPPRKPPPPLVVIHRGWL